MGIPVAAILKGIDLVLAGAQVVDKGVEKYKSWKRKRALVKRIKALKKVKQP